ncbi:MAG: PIN domain-containing protein [Longimicrobiales bacterium]
MASLIYLDTHVVAWLYATGAEALSGPATEIIEASEDVRISPMVRLELQYLFEIGRVGEPAANVVDALAGTLGLAVCDSSYPAVVHEALRHSWTRDPFDRLIVAQAALHGAPLVTKDQTLHQNYAAAVW